MFRFLFILLLSFLQIEAAPVQKRKAKSTTPILTQKERQVAITSCKEFLENAFNSVLSDQSLKNLFVYKEIIEEVIPEIKEVVAEESENIFTDEWLILNEIGRALKPEGKVFFENQYILCINGYRTLRAGDVFFANYNGMTFSITIVRVEENKFTLKLNNHILVFDY